MSGTPEIGSGQHTLRGARTPAEAEQLHRARVTVANRSLDVDDCTELLQMLGLIPTPEVES